MWVCMLTRETLRVCLFNTSFVCLVVEPCPVEYAIAPAGAAFLLARVEHSDRSYIVLVGGKKADLAFTPTLVKGLQHLLMRTLLAMCDFSVNVSEAGSFSGSSGGSVELSAAGSSASEISWR